jgi:hypothetical protein
MSEFFELCERFGEDPDDPDTIDHIIDCCGDISDAYDELFADDFADADIE